jgi:hypothetical protein
MNVNNIVTSSDLYLRVWNIRFRTFTVNSVLQLSVKGMLITLRQVAICTYTDGIFGSGPLPSTVYCNSL